MVSSAKLPKQLCISLWKVAGALHNPKGMRSYSHTFVSVISDSSILGGFMSYIIKFPRINTKFFFLNKTISAAQGLVLSLTTPGFSMVLKRLRISWYMVGGMGLYRYCIRAAVPVGMVCRTTPVRPKSSSCATNTPSPNYFQ